ncbi:uncharacterized protein [Miscanthus floridulus]|uniref:uncharacterized protein n=1 Tax=Miscanthus floridulus TaxID=154761 RepID=UPI003457CF1B
MAVPNYTYLKLKMLGLHEIIIVGTSFQRTYKCEVECCDHAAAIVASMELTPIRKKAAEEAPNTKWSSRSFELVEGTKEVLLDPISSNSKVVRIDTSLSSK